MAAELAGAHRQAIDSGARTGRDVGFEVRNGGISSLWLVAEVGLISALAFFGIQLTVEPPFAKSTTAADNI